jgi:hypothetical protein
LKNRLIKEGDFVDIKLKESFKNSISLNKIIIVLSAIGYAISLILGVTLYNAHQSLSVLENEVDKVSNELSIKNNDFNNSINKMKIELDKYSDIAQKTKKLEMGYSLSRVEQLISNGGVVAGDLSVNRLTFLEAKNTLFANVDVKMQSSSWYLYEGQGKFNMTDREVKLMILNLISNIKQSYNLYKQELDVNLPNWEDADMFAVTIESYEIGTYTDGTFKLVGEQ